MGNQSPIIKFGIAADGRRSSHWRLRAGMNWPELFLEREAYGKQWHFSLHASGEWHLKANGKVCATWGRPGELVPGYTRAVGIVQSAAMAHREDPTPRDVIPIPVATDAESTVFSLFLERPGANLDDRWPGKNAMGSVFVGRIPLAAGAGTCCVVATQALLPPGKCTLPRPSDDELRQMRKWAVNGVLVLTIVGEFDDGAVALVDLRGDQSIAGAIGAALA